MHNDYNSAVMDRLKKTTRIWLAVYPTVLVFLMLFGDALKDWPLPLRLLVSTLVVVIIVSNITDPLIGKIFHQLGRLFIKARL